LSIELLIVGYNTNIMSYKNKKRREIRREIKSVVVSPLPFLIPMSNLLLKCTTATQYYGKLCLARPWTK